MNPAAHILFDGSTPIGVETARFRLRLLNASDEALYCDIYCNPDTMKYVGTPLSAAQATRSFRAAIKQSTESQAKRQFLVVADKTSDVRLGICGVSYGMPRYDAAEIGIMLTAVARKHGFSNEVFEGFLSYVFSMPDVQEVWSRYDVENTGADRLVRGLGFVVGFKHSSDEEHPSQSEAYICHTDWQALIHSTNRG